MSRLRSANIHLKLERAVAHINNLEREIHAFTQRKPYTIRIKNGIQNHLPVGRLVAVKNRQVGPPEPRLVLLAGEALYQLRSVLDHTIHDLIVNNKQSAKITRKTQFPIFDTSQRYTTEAGRMINGVSKTVAALIEREQPYNKTPHSPQDDPLWILQHLNNTDKHRFVTSTVLGLHGVNISDKQGRIGTLNSPDITLKHNKVFWSFTVTPPLRHDEIRAELNTAIAFKEAMQIGGMIVPMHAMLWNIATRVYEVTRTLGLTKPARHRTPTWV